MLRLDSRQGDHALLRWEQHVKLSLVSQKELKAEQDWHQIARWVGVGELGKERERPANVRRMVNGQPDVDTAQITRLPGPGDADSRNGLPAQSLMMDVKGNYGNGCSGI